MSLVTDLHSGYLSWDHYYVATLFWIDPTPNGEFPVNGSSDERVQRLVDQFRHASVSSLSESCKVWIGKQVM